MCVYPKIGESACSASSAPHPCRAPSHPAQVSPTSERPLPHASSTSSSQRRPQNLRAQLPAPAEPQQPSQTVPCASHAKSSRPITHPTHKPQKKFYPHMHQPSQTAEQPRQACHCCARAVLAHPTSHATAVLELRPRVPMFLPLCERPCSSASRCPQGSMEPYACRPQRRVRHCAAVAAPSRPPEPQQSR
jgi:hypothetical protein